MLKFRSKETKHGLLKVTENKPLDSFTDHAQINNMPTPLSGSLLDKVNKKKTLMKDLLTHETVRNIYVSDYDFVRIVKDFPISSRI